MIFGIFTLWETWGAVAGVTFLAIVVMAGLHFKDPKQRGPLLFVACVLAAAAWPLLFPYWAIAFVWKVLGAVQLRRAKVATGLVEASPAPEPAAPKGPVRAYGPGGKVETRL